MSQSVAPNLTATVLKRLLRHRAVQLRRQLAETTSLCKRVEIACNSRAFCSNQRPKEILALLEQVQSLRPRTLCEIGTDRGGTLALFASVAHPNARILSIDLKYAKYRSGTYGLLAQPGQQITCFEADSHSSETFTRVRRWLEHRQLDFLFIDGDHTYEGVRQDYEMYGALVRFKGIVAFHDILPDFRTRCGGTSAANVGDVPRFWKNLTSELNGRAQSIVEDPEQNGYGIGIVSVGDK